MQLLRAISRFLPSAAVIVILLVSTPRARAADEITNKATSLTGETIFILTPAKLSLAKAAAAQRKLPGGFGALLFQSATEENAFKLNRLDLPLILARGDAPASTGVLAPQTGGNSHRSNSSVARIAGSAKPMLSRGQARIKTDDGLLTVDPATIDFGSVPVGSYQNQGGTLMASGSDVTISSATISSPEFTLSGLSLPLTIPAGGHQDYTVSFAPLTPGTASATLTFADDGNVLATQSLTGIGGDRPAHTVYLSWNASISSDVVGYNVYRGTTSGGPYGRINSATDLSTVYTDGSVLDGSTYYYVTTAVDASGQESTYSNEVQAVIP